MKNKSAFFVLSAVMWSSFTVPVSHAAKTSSPEFSDGETSFNKVKRAIQSGFFGKPVSEDTLWLGAAEGMLQSLNEGESRWNKLLTPIEMKEIDDENLSEITGIGVEMNFNSETGLAHIFGITPDSPAAKNGILAGDNIISVNGSTFQGKELWDVVQAIRGPVGDSVKLKLLRGDQVVALSFKRDRIPVPPVEWKIFRDKVGLLSIDYFSDKTPGLLKKALEHFKTAKIKSLIVDLRGNSGGVFDEALKSAALFIPKNKPIAHVVSQNRSEQEVVNTEDPILAKVSTVILTNGSTAAGAELFAAALREQTDAALVGEKTLGKWSVQAVEKLKNGYGMRYTVQLFRSSKNQSFEEVGLKPQIEIALKGESSTRLTRLSGNLEEKVQKDPQLRAAYEWLKSDSE